MQETKNFLVKQKWSLLGLLAAIALLVLCSILTVQKGIVYKGAFLRTEAENCWQGKVLGEPVTVLRRPVSDGTEVQIDCLSGTRIFLVEGSSETGREVSVTEGDALLFEGFYLDGILKDLDGNYHSMLDVYVSYGGDTYYLDENGNQVPDTPLIVGVPQVIEIGFGPEEVTRGEIMFVVMAIVVLALFFLELWCPQLFFHWEVGRFAAGAVEPSDAYLIRRTLGLVMTAGVFLLLLVTGFVV